jgi:GalNAc5-diNAcBac-PP-undecaprenol beta-1,3-glucosyltransferase
MTRLLELLNFQNPKHQSESGNSVRVTEPAAGALEISVVITTYNRCQFVGRAIQSALDQRWQGLEVVVIDDASTDQTAEVVQRLFPGVRYVRQEKNAGPNAVRNRGILEASRAWIVFLDDDDTLEPGALQKIAQRIEALAESRNYPLFQFAHTNALMPTDFMVVRLNDYLTERVVGDFAPAICKRRFLEAGLSYVETLRNGEGMLLWRIAEDFGIPTWSDRVQRLHADAPLRATSTGYQLRNAAQFAELQEYTLREFGELLAARSPPYYEKKRFGAAAYRLLAGDRQRARAHLRLAWRKRMSAPAAALWLCSFLPLPFVRKCFSAYRQRTARAQH